MQEKWVKLIRAENSQTGCITKHDRWGMNFQSKTGNRRNKRERHCVRSNTQTTIMEYARTICSVSRYIVCQTQYCSKPASLALLTHNPLSKRVKVQVAMLWRSSLSLLNAICMHQYVPCKVSFSMCTKSKKNKHVTSRSASKNAL